MPLYELHHRPDLCDPVLVVVLEGWVDAGLGAAGALGALFTAIETDVVATFDVDALLDHRARRPVVQITDGVNAGLVWPELTLRAGRDADGNGLVVLSGPEPDHLWRAFCDDVAELAGELGARMMV
ncbi:MAG: proteasome protein, partial [Acidimicrobiia bacterium]